MSIQRVINWTFLLCSGLIVTLIALLFLVPPADSRTATSSPAAISRLTHDLGNALHPVWSPDNRLIAFESNRDGAFQIYVMNADGSNQRALTLGSNESRRPLWTPGANRFYTIRPMEFAKIFG